MKQSLTVDYLERIANSVGTKNVPTRPHSWLIDTPIRTAYSEFMHREESTAKMIREFLKKATENLSAPEICFELAAAKEIITLVRKELEE